MPLHELYSMSKGKVDHKEMNSARAATDQYSSAPKSDLFELVWENGQISVEGQSSSSSRARKTPTCKTLPSHTPKGHAQDKDSGHAIANETNTRRMGKFGDLDTGWNEMDLRQEEDVVMPWLNYGMDDSLQQHEYSSGFLHELSGVAMNDLPATNKFSLLDRRSNYCCNQVFRDSHKHSSRHVFLSSEQGVLSKGSEEVETSAPKASTGQLYPPTPSFLHQCQTSFACIRSRESDIAENNTTTSNATQQHVPCGEIPQIPPPASSGFSGLNMDRQDPNMSSNSSTIMNFSHFAKPAAIVKTNLQNIGLSSGLRSESVGIKNKGAAATGSNPPESTKVDLGGECPKKSAIHEPSKVDLKPLEPKSLEQDACKEDMSKSKGDQTCNQVLGESGRKGHEAVEKCMEPAVVASSSVCSGNGAERGSYDPKQKLKRKSRDTEDSDCHSEDVEDESVGVKKAGHARGGISSKRNRSSEVHNLSERRRRDRINERMRALQELIPNCNKADKASMLDEAIEYLKTLQFQLHIMSMGGGLYMPTMMFPAGMQPHMSPFSPMSVGMQMGLGVGYGMGMPEVNDGSSRFPMVQPQVPHLQGTHLPVAHTSGPTGLHGMARPNPQMFGLQHGQGLPMPMPCAPMYSFPGESLVNPSAVGLNPSGTAGHAENAEPASAPSLKDPIPMPIVNSQAMQNTNGCSNTTNQMPTQCEATTGGFEQSTLVLDSGHASSPNDRGAVNPSKEDNLVSDKCRDS